MIRTLAMTCAVFATLVPVRAADVDRTDPAAVTKAFLERVSAGDHQALFELMTEDKGLRSMLGMLIGSAASQLDVWGTTATLVGAVGVLPAFEAGEPQPGDGEIVVPLTQQFTRRANLVLRKDEQGRYAVDLRATISRSIADEQNRTVFEQQLKQFENSQMAAAATAQPENYKVYQAQGNMYQVAQALNDFAAERGTYPEAAIWMDELLPYLDNDEKSFADTVHPDEQYSFAFNVELGGKAAETDWQAKDKLPLIASVAGNLPNAVFVPADLAKEKPRYGSINIVMMASHSQVYLGEGETPVGLAAEQVKSEDAMRQLRALHKAAKAYADQHNGRLPDAAQWTDQIQPLIDTKGLPNGTALASPFTEDTRCTYAINPDIAGKDIKTLLGHRKLMLFIEVEPGPPNRAAKASDPGPAWHRQRWQPSAAKSRCAVYLNGEARMVNEG